MPGDAAGPITALATLGAFVVAVTLCVHALARPVADAAERPTPAN